MVTINPYLCFDGNAEEAFNFYKSVFGGDFSLLTRFKDAPPQEGIKTSEECKEKILHVQLPVGKDCVLMGCDKPEQMSEMTPGDNVSISIQASSEEEADKLFEGLSQGGKITMPLAKAFWNAYFGMCTDKFGIHWMINYDYGSQEKK